MSSGLTGKQDKLDLGNTGVIEPFSLEGKAFFEMGRLRFQTRIKVALQFGGSRGGHELVHRKECERRSRRRIHACPILEVLLELLCCEGGVFGQPVWASEVTESLESRDEAKMIL
jgi:hypothetical protein